MYLNVLYRHNAYMRVTTIQTCGNLYSPSAKITGRKHPWLKHVSRQQLKNQHDIQHHCCKLVVLFNSLAQDRNALLNAHKVGFSLRTMNMHNFFQCKLFLPRSCCCCSLVGSVFVIFFFTPRHSMGRPLSLNQWVITTLANLNFQNIYIIAYNSSKTTFTKWQRK